MQRRWPQVSEEFESALLLLTGCREGSEASGLNLLL